VPAARRALNPRLVGLAVALVLGIVVVALLSLLFGDRDETKAASIAPVSATRTIAASRATEPATSATSATSASTTAVPTTTTTLPQVTQNHVFVLGDSVLLGAANEIPAALPGWQVIVDAKVSRFLNQGIEVLQARRAEIGNAGVVVIQQGNNYLGNEEQFRDEIDQTMAVLAGVPKVIWLTVAEFTQSRVDVNKEILAAAERYPNIVLADWNGTWLPNRHAFASRDGLHLTRPGARAMAALIASVVGAPPSATP
jgi:hypothetical protein